MNGHDNRARIEVGRCLRARVWWQLSGQTCVGDAQVSLLLLIGKEAVVDAAAKMTSKGQVTVPKAVRDALGLKEGDEIVFRVEGNRAVLARTPDP